MATDLHISGLLDGEQILQQKMNYALTTIQLPHITIPAGHIAGYATMIISLLKSNLQNGIHR